ncbi:MAG: GNAT family N-acetyltransferase, partial [Aquihabitans sp.]
RGYLQRLAVDPRRHRGGIGRSLVIDALVWLRQTGCRVAVVNTQTINTGAYQLYVSCGFVPEPDGLTVLSLDLQPAT